MTPRVQDAELTGAVCDLCRSDRHAVPVLQAGDYEYGVAGGFTLSRCTACDLYYQTPRPAREVIPGYYPPSYAVYGDDPVVGWLFRLTYWLDARRVARLIGPRGRVLEVGCGAGGALTALERAGKWEVCGLELDAEAARQAARRGFNVRQGDLVDTDFPPESFDLIRMGHVIEHVRDPIATLRRAWELLRPGGRSSGRPRTSIAGTSGFRTLLGRAPLSAPHCAVQPRDDPPCLRADGIRGNPHRPPAAHGRLERWYPELAGRPGRASCSAQRARALVPRADRAVPPVTMLQALVSRTATMAFIARRPEA